MNKLLLVGFAWTTFLTSGLQHPASGQHQHTAPRTPSQAGEAEAAHHSFLDQERAAIERGEGFGMAMVADRNGYPGPKHVLELTAELQLTPEQQTAMEKLFAQMKAQALARGKECCSPKRNSIRCLLKAGPSRNSSSRPIEWPRSAASCVGCISPRIWLPASCLPRSN